MRQFDLYEFLGYISPGMLLLVGIQWIWPEANTLVPATGITVGAFGIGVFLAYAAGQLLQTIGTGIEKVWWSLCGGMPTDWLRSQKHELVAPVQAGLVEPAVIRMLGGASFKLDGVNAKQWYSITRQVYAAVSGPGRAARVDAFNGQYGLCRGIVTVLVVLLLLNVFANPPAWKAHGVLVGLLVLAVFRMHRFGVNYARELVVEFVQLAQR